MVEVPTVHVWLRWNTETCWSHFEEMEWGKRENNRGVKYVYMEMSQWNPLYSYHILTEILFFLKKEHKLPWWLTPIILVTCEAEVRSMWFKMSPGKKFTRLHLTNSCVQWYMSVIPTYIGSLENCSSRATWRPYNSGKKPGTVTCACHSSNSRKQAVLGWPRQKVRP
jgi:hypothetical protein